MFHSERSTLLSNINEIDFRIFNESESSLTRILLYGDESFKDEVNLPILDATINLMNHVMFSEFAGVFLFIHNYLATILQFLKF